MSVLITMCSQQAVSEGRARAAKRNKERDIMCENEGSVLGLSGPKGKGAQAITDKTQRTFLSSLGVSKASVLWEDQSLVKTGHLGRFMGESSFMGTNRAPPCSAQGSRSPSELSRNNMGTGHGPQGGDLTNKYPTIQPE